MMTLVQLEDRFPRLEMMPRQESGLFELRQHTVDGGEPDIQPFVEQQPIHVLGGQMPDLAVLEQVENFQPRRRGFQPGRLEVVQRAHALRVGSNNQRV